MPTHEKEINNYLFDQLEIVEDALELAQRENAQDTVAYLKKKKERIERKLYQNPPLADNN